MAAVGQDLVPILAKFNREVVLPDDTVAQRLDRPDTE